MKLYVKNKVLLIIGLAMFAAGVILFAGRVYVASGIRTMSVHIGSLSLPTGILFIPFVFGIVMLFCMPKKKWPWFTTLAGLICILIWAVITINIRVRRTSLALWLGILVLYFGGIVLVIRSISLKRKQN